MKPPFRWVGGKTKMLPYIDKYLPREAWGEYVNINRYFEPMVGGGALFFDYGDVAEQCFLNDINVPLMHTYMALRDNFTTLRYLVEGNSSRSYNDVRTVFNAEKSNPTQNPVRLAVPFIMLMATCFNGLYRENLSGGFNASQGGDSKGKPHGWDRIDWEHLEKAGKALQGTTLSQGSIFSWPWVGVELPGLGDVVVYDPPFAGEFSDYHSSRFTLEDHRMLHLQAQEFANNGATVIVCGSNNEWSWKVYGKPTEVVTVRRTVGASLRGDVTEALYVYAADK